MDANPDPKKAADTMAESIDMSKGQIAGDKPDHEHIEGNALLVNKDGTVRRLPVPSADPNDPLNFRTWEKYSVIFCCCWFSVMSLAIAGGLGGILNVFFEMYGPEGKSPDDIAMLITIPTLCIGLGNYIILPLSHAFGRRPIFLASMVILLASTIAGALQNSYEGHLTSRIIQGLATGASESLLPLMLTEVTFLHQRGLVFGLYWTIQNILSQIINLVSTYLNAAAGWRWYYWLFVITVAAGLVFALLGAFETQFSRPAASLDGQVVVTDEFGVTTVLADAEAQEYLDRVGRDQPAGGDRAAAPASTAFGPRRTYAQKVAQWWTPHPEPLRVIGRSWLHMVQSFTSPGILYAVLSSSIVLGCSVGMSLTYNAVLLDGYGWAPQNVGLINVGGMVGALLGSLYCTFAGQPFLLWMARRNHGVHLPEHHLLILIFPAIVGVAMLLLYGYTAQGGATWWGPYLAWTFFQYAFIAVLVVSTTLASEVAPKHPGPALVVVVGSKNIISFGVTYGLTPMVARMGYQRAFGTLAGIMAAIFLLGIPVYFLNPRWRAWAGERERRKGVTMTD